MITGYYSRLYRESMGSYPQNTAVWVIIIGTIFAVLLIGGGVTMIGIGAHKWHSDHSTAVGLVAAGSSISGVILVAVLAFVIWCCCSA